MRQPGAGPDENDDPIVAKLINNDEEEGLDEKLDQNI